MSRHTLRAGQRAFEPTIGAPMADWPEDEPDRVCKGISLGLRISVVIWLFGVWAFALVVWL